VDIADAGIRSYLHDTANQEWEVKREDEEALETIIDEPEQVEEEEVNEFALLIQCRLEDEQKMENALREVLEPFADWEVLRGSQ